MKTCIIIFIILSVALEVSSMSFVYALKAIVTSHARNNEQRVERSFLSTDLNVDSLQGVWKGKEYGYNRDLITGACSTKEGHADATITIDGVNITLTDTTSIVGTIVSYSNNEIIFSYLQVQMCLIWIPSGKTSATAFMDLFSFSVCPTARTPTCDRSTNLYKYSLSTKSELSKSAIIGITIAAIIVAIGIGLAIFAVYWKKRNARRYARI